jgi:hypothetical protein
MSRIETSLALPVFHDRVPVRGATGNFLGQLQATEALYADARDGLPLPADRPATMPQVQYAANRPGPAAELYGLAALPLHHLSYRALPPTSAGEATAAVSLASSSSRGEPAASAVTAVTVGGSARTADMDATLPVRSSHMQNSDEDSTVSSARAEVRERLAADWLRKLRRYDVPGGVELVLRDYEGASGGDPLPTLLDYCRRQDIHLVRVVLNGHVVWPRNQSGQG